MRQSPSLTISAKKEGILSAGAIASSSLKNPHPGKQDEKEPTLVPLNLAPGYSVRFQHRVPRLPGRIFKFSRESHELFAGSRRSSTASVPSTSLGSVWSSTGHGRKEL